MDPLNNKTPVSLLHEICTRSNITPKYDLLQVEGAIHEPIFQYRLTLDYMGQCLEETGSGRSKKEAKHNTARGMLRCMREISGDIVGLEEVEQNNEPFEEFRINGPDMDYGGNPVGVLQELCMKMKYPPPTYEVHSEHGLPHERLFAIACRVGEQFTEIGSGKSKKLAKRMAAHMMAERIRNLPSDSALSLSYEEDDEELCRAMKALSHSIDVGNNGREKLFYNSHVEKLINIYKMFQKFKGHQIKLLQMKDFEPDDPVKIMEDLEKEGDFKSMIIEFDGKTANNKYQCLIQLTFEPPQVLFGVGDTREEAKLRALKDVFNFFKLLYDQGRCFQIATTNSQSAKPSEEEQIPKIVEVD